jgi:hypothetical protein
MQRSAKWSGTLLSSRVWPFRRTAAPLFLAALMEPTRYIRDFTFSGTQALRDFLLICELHRIYPAIQVCFVDRSGRRRRGHIYTHSTQVQRFTQLHLHGEVTTGESTTRHLFPATNPSTVNPYSLLRSATFSLRMCLCRLEYNVARSWVAGTSLHTAVPRDPSSFGLAWPLVDDYSIQYNSIFSSRIHAATANEK